MQVRELLPEAGVGQSRPPLKHLPVVLSPLQG